MALDTLLGTPTVQQTITKEKYVEELVKYLRHVHKYVAEQHTKVREDEQYKRLRVLGGTSKESLQVGDYVLYKETRRLEAGTSERARRPWRDEIYQIVHAPQNRGSRVFVIADAISGRTDNLGFS